MSRDLGKNVIVFLPSIEGIVATNTGYGTSANKLMPETEQQRDLKSVVWQRCGHPPFFGRSVRAFSHENFFYVDWYPQMIRVVLKVS